MAHLKSLRKHVVYLLTKGGAHATFEEAVKDVPPAARGKVPEGAAHSLWDLVEHMRIAQWDILEFCKNAKHVSPKFPKGYWPKTSAPPNAKAWDKSVKGFLADRDAMCKLVEKKSTDLFAEIPHGEGHTILREALLVADHNAYTVGEIVITRRLLGVWK
jgi:DinB family protein